MRQQEHVGRTIVYLPVPEKPVPNLFERPGPTHPAPPPLPNPALDCYIKSGRGPKYRPVCALGNYVRMGDTPVCYGDGAEHNARCPEARRLARQRECWHRVQGGLVILAAVVWTIALALMIGAKTCGLGVQC